MKAGKSVVTANKALLAEDGATLSARRREHASTSTTRRPWPARSRCCARCASRWPATTSTGSSGIVNGTTNYILDKMDSSGAGFTDALDEAQALGYAEADPTADVEGFDAAAKAAILAQLAFHTRVTAADVHREGITEVTAADVGQRQGDGLRRQAARDLRRAPIGEAAAARRVRVHPAMIPRTHPLASVREAYNAVFVEAESAGSADVLRRGGRRRADRERRARRHRRGRPQPR